MFWVLIALLVVTILWKLLTRGDAVVKTEDYLEVLSYHVWKRGIQIRDEMQEKKGGRLALVEVYVALDRLEGEGWVERRVRDSEDNESERILYARGIRIHEFKLTKDGIKRRAELDKEDTAPFSFMPQPTT